MVKLEDAVGAPVWEMRGRPPLRVVGPRYVLAAGAGVARPAPFFVNPPAPLIRPVNVTAPAVDVWLTWLTEATTVSLKTIGTDTVRLPKPVPLTLMAALPVVTSK